MAGRSIIPAQHRFVKAVARALRQPCGIRPGSHLIVATSGGSDSVALLRALAALAPRRRWNLQLTVGHVQHHQRPEAEGDADFVKQLAQRLGIPMQRADLHLRRGAGNFESLARAERYSALGTMAAQLSARHVATAHQGDDQLETLLMRILRGTSVRGLRGIRWRRRLVRGTNLWLVRPMLETDRAMARAFLDDLKQPWREDPTNRDVTRQRARLRHDVLPVFRSLEPSASRRAVRLSQHMRSMCQLLDAEARRYSAEICCNRAPGMTTMGRAAARQMPRVVLQQLLRTQLVEAGAKADSLGARTLDRLVAAIRDHTGGERRFDLSSQVRVFIRRDEVEVCGKSEERGDMGEGRRATE